MDSTRCRRKESVKINLSACAGLLAAMHDRFLNKELTLFLKCREFWCCKYKIFIDLVITEQWKGEKQKRELVHLQWPLCPSMKVVIPVNSLTSLLLPELLESSLTTSPFITELCHLDCSSRSKLLEGSFLLFFHLANRTSRNAKSEWTPVSYLQNNTGHESCEVPLSLF